MFLKKVKRWFNNVTGQNRFSDFAHLGDLRQYSLAELQMKLKSKWSMETLSFVDYQSVRFSNRLSVYTLLYTLGGEFIQIKEEKWMDEHIVYTSEVELGNFYTQALH